IIEVYTLSLHDALPILKLSKVSKGVRRIDGTKEEKQLNGEHAEVTERFHSVVSASFVTSCKALLSHGLNTDQHGFSAATVSVFRSEEHTSELQSPDHLV